MMNATAYYRDREIARLRDDSSRLGLEADDLRSKLAEARAERDEALSRHAKDVDAALRERDEARAEAERLRAELQQDRTIKAARNAGGADRDLLASILAEVECISHGLRGHHCGDRK